MINVVLLELAVHVPPCLIPPLTTIGLSTTVLHHHISTVLILVYNGLKLEVNILTVLL